jgi:acyl-CoA reductase-like NAD-dependent aldehyde dehydrogenase
MRIREWIVGSAVIPQPRLAGRRQAQPSADGFISEDITMAIEKKLLIDGELTDSAQRLDIIDPAQGKVYTSVPRATKDDADRAIAAAKAAQPAWAALSLAQRRGRLEQLADLVKEHADELARSLVQEQGKPLAEARMEIGFAEVFIRHFAQIELPVEVAQDDADFRIEVHHKPLGVVVGITPWNFPVLISLFKVAPALLLGNTFILKPSPTTPVTVLKVAALAQNIFPRGVLNVLVDANDLGAYLSGHPDVAKISFTGSTATGKKIMQGAASTLKRLTLELGGNDAGIVLPDVDVPAVAQKIFDSAFFNCGQVCIALKRIYAHADIYDELCAALAKIADAAKIGNGLEEGTQIGPLQNAMQYEKAQHFLRIAAEDGKIIAGGTVPGGAGYFIRPTIVRDIQDGSELVDVEQFAPILPIIKFTDVEKAVASANALTYGLGGSVWSADTDKAYKLAQRLESGTVWVNHHLHFGPNIPFCGAKESGIGVEFSEAGLKEFSQTAVISIAKH